MIQHDLHVHTNLSACCNDDDSVPGKILARASEKGIKVIGFSDHFWDESMPGASRWYEPQNCAHVSRIREQIPDEHEGVRVLVGCEAEFWGRDRCGISPQTAERFDFVLMPVSHLHMAEAGVSGSTSDRDVAGILVKRFLDALKLDFVTGIPHPFLPLGFLERVDAIVALIPDSALEDCFGMAAARGVSIEVTTAFFPATRGVELKGRSDETFIRVLSIARRSGCVFHCASDAHTLRSIGEVLELEPYLVKIGIREDDFLPLVKPQSGE